MEFYILFSFEYMFMKYHSIVYISMCIFLVVNDVYCWDCSDL